MRKKPGSRGSFDPGAAAAPGSGVFGLPHAPDEAEVVLVPAPFEATTSYGGGAAKGPRAILEASRQVDLYDLETGRPYESGIAMLPADPRIRRWDREARPLAARVIAAGGAVDGKRDLAQARDRVNAISGRLNAAVRAIAGDWLDRGKLVGVIGGDHSVPFGAIEEHAERHPGMGILHLDAHADLREAFEGFTFSHASIMHNVATRIPKVGRIVQVGVRDFSEEELDMIRGSGRRIRAYFDAEIREEKLGGTPFVEIIRHVVADLPEAVYLSFDIDGLDPTLCPHTGTPVPGGFSFHEAVHLVSAVAESGRTIVGFDLCEVAPGPRGDEWDGNVAARLLYKMIGFALYSRRGGKTDRPGPARKR